MVAAHRHHHHQEGRSLEVEAKVETVRTMKMGPMVRTIQRINTSFDTHQDIDLLTFFAHGHHTKWLIAVNLSSLLHAEERREIPHNSVS
jgi:hypothetical protein